MPNFYVFSYTVSVLKSRIQYYQGLTVSKVVRKLLDRKGQSNFGSMELELHFGNPALCVSTNSQVVRGKFLEVKVRR